MVCVFEVAAGCSHLTQCGHELGRRQAVAGLGIDRDRHVDFSANPGRGIEHLPRRGVLVVVVSERVTLTDEGQRRLDAANPAIRALEAEMERAFTPDQITTVKAWLVESAARLEIIAHTGNLPKPSRRRRARG